MLLIGSAVFAACALLWLASELSTLWGICPRKGDKK